MALPRQNCQVAVVCVHCLRAIFYKELVAQRVERDVVLHQGGVCAMHRHRAVVSVVDRAAFDVAVRQRPVHVVV